MPFATRAPMNGGVKIGHVDRDVGARGHLDLGLVLLGLARRQLAAALGASELGIEVARLHARS